MAMFLVFNIWILNIFINVVGTEYAEEKARVRDTFTQVRTGHILTYLQRAKYLRLTGKHKIFRSQSFLGFALMGSITVCFLVTTSAFVGWKLHPFVSLPLLISAVFFWNLVQFQTPTPSPDSQYLWLLKDKEKEGLSWREERLLMERRTEKEKEELLGRSSHKEEGKDLVEERKKLEEERKKLAEEWKKLAEERK